jgi:hypothetical protein
LVIGAGNGKKYRESVDLHISREREREREREVTFLMKKNDFSADPYRMSLIFTSADGI